jgi:cytosine/uracil/thiamine/allantoin permease
MLKGRLQQMSQETLHPTPGTDYSDRLYIAPFSWFIGVAISGALYWILMAGMPGRLTALEPKLTR